MNSEKLITILYQLGTPIEELELDMLDEGTLGGQVEQHKDLTIVKTHQGAALHLLIEGYGYKFEALLRQPVSEQRIEELIDEARISLF